ncbi:hypothetical protein Mapa_013227 [Marchantia paleacea]|nr:hypothetical protein Mapa_013227 [Marchantia paleacea]
MEQAVVQQGDLCEGDARGTPKHVWLMTIPLFSHVKGFLQFAELLASHGLTVTMFTTESEIRRLHASQTGTLDSWNREGLDIRLETLDFPVLVYGDGTYDPERCLNTILSAEAAFEEVLKVRVKNQSTPTCFFSDVWLPRTREVASQYGIPAFVYSLFSASYLAAVIYITQLESAGLFKLPSSPFDKRSQDGFISLPGLSLMRISDFPADYFKDDAMYLSASRHAASLQKSEIIVFSNCKEMESSSFRALEKLLKASAENSGSKMPQVITVGPFLNKSFRDGFKDKDNGDKEKHPSLRLMDSQPANSVLFVAFGSIGSFTQEQIVELAIALQNSQQPFVCVLNPPLKVGGSKVDDIFSVIPSDCISETKGRGLFLTWAPQLEILAHPSVGGFLTHCGQNSVLESMYAGVPLLAWPLFSDQSINCRFLVDGAQVALEICKGTHQLVDRKEIETGVRALLQGDEGKATKKKALEMKEVIREAVGENGSSVRNSEALINLIRGF